MAMKTKVDKNEHENMSVGEVFIGVGSPKTRLIDHIKFGFGFYIGFTAARTLKYLLLGKVNKK